MVDIKYMDENLRDSFKRAKKDIFANKENRSLIKANEKEIKELLVLVTAHETLMGSMDSETVEKRLNLHQNYMDNLADYLGSLKRQFLKLEEKLKQTRADQREFATATNASLRKLESSVDKLSKNVTVSTKKPPMKVVSTKKRTARFNLRETNLLKVKGIGQKESEKLNKAGIKTTVDLLKQGATKTGRKNISKQAKIRQPKILEWVNRVDLMRVKGIGEEYSDLLENSGVDTVPELAQRKPENLHKKMFDVNKKKNFVKREPPLSKVKKWVIQAKRLKKVVEH